MSTPPPWGSPDGVDLMTADLVLAVERGGAAPPGSYLLKSAAGAPLGSLSKQTPKFGRLFGRASRFRLLTVDGTLIGSMLRATSFGSFGGSRFEVSNAAGRLIGRIEQDPTLPTSDFLLTTARRQGMRLVEGRNDGRDWRLLDGLDDSVQLGQLSRLHQGATGMLAATRRLSIQLSPQLVGGPRLVALLAAFCLDYSRRLPERRYSSGRRRPASDPARFNDPFNTGPFNTGPFDSSPLDTGPFGSDPDPGPDGAGFP